MSRLENGLKVTVLTQSAIFFLPDTLKVTRSTTLTPKSYDEHPRQVKYGSPHPPRAYSMCLICPDPLGLSRFPRSGLVTSFVTQFTIDIEWLMARGEFVSGEVLPSEKVTIHF